MISFNIQSSVFITFLSIFYSGADFQDLRKTNLLTSKGIFRNTVLIGPKLTSNLFSSLAKTVQTENIRESGSELVTEMVLTDLNYKADIEGILTMIGNDDITTILPLLSHKWIPRMRNGELIETVNGIAEMTVLQTTQMVKKNIENNKSDSFYGNLNDYTTDFQINNDNNNVNNDKYYHNNKNKKQSLSSIITEFENVKNFKKHENIFTEITDIELSAISNCPFSVLTQTIISLSTPQFFTLLENFEFFGMDEEIFANEKHGNIANLVETKIAKCLSESVNVFEKYLINEITKFNQMSGIKNEILIENINMNNMNYFSANKKEEIRLKSLNLIRDSARLINRFSELFGTWKLLTKKNKKEFLSFINNPITLFAIQNSEISSNLGLFSSKEFSPSISEEINDEKILFFVGNDNDNNKNNNNNNNNNNGKYDNNKDNKNDYNERLRFESKDDTNNFQNEIETKINFIFALGKFRFPLFSKDKSVYLTEGMTMIKRFFVINLIHNYT